MTTYSTTQPPHENWANADRLCSSCCVRDTVRASRVACVHVALRRVSRATKNRHVDLLYAQLSDRDRGPHYVSISGHRCVLRPWRVVRDLSVAARALGSRAVRGAGLRCAFLRSYPRALDRSQAAIQTRGAINNRRISSPRIAEGARAHFQAQTLSVRGSCGRESDA